MSISKIKEIKKELGYSKRFIKEEQDLERMFFGATTEEMAKNLKKTKNLRKIFPNFMTIIKK